MHRHKGNTRQPNPTQPSPTGAHSTQHRLRRCRAWGLMGLSHGMCAVLSAAVASKARRILSCCACISTCCSDAVPTSAAVTAASGPPPPPPLALTTLPPAVPPLVTPPPPPLALPPAPTVALAWPGVAAEPVAGVGATIDVALPDLSRFRLIPYGHDISKGTRESDFHNGRTGSVFLSMRCLRFRKHVTHLCKRHACRPRQHSTA